MTREGSGALHPETTPIADVLIVEENENVGELMGEALREEGYAVRRVRRLTEARTAFEEKPGELVVLDLGAATRDSFELLRYLASHPGQPAILVLVNQLRDPSLARALQSGASDYLLRPVIVETFLHRIESTLALRKTRLLAAFDRRRRRLEEPALTSLLPSAPMQKLYDRVRVAAGEPGLPVLITGEPGVGKRYLAQVLHEYSAGSHEPLVGINCAQLDRGLLASELFGSEPGAVSFADDRSLGLCELVGRGTLLLEEIGRLPEDLQPRVLALIETGHFRRVGSTTELRSRARVVATSGEDLDAAVRTGAFRADLHERLRAVHLVVPPLRERKDDIDILARRFFELSAQRRGAALRIDERVFEALGGYSWPGNVRELAAICERAVVVADGRTIAPEHLQLPAYDAETRKRRYAEGMIGGDFFAEEVAESGLTLSEAEAMHISRVLEAHGGNRTRAARALGIARSTLIRKLDEMGLDRFRSRK